MSVFGEAAQRQLLGRALRELRGNVNLTGEQLAEQLGKSQSWVSRVEGGECVPTAEEVERWVRTTGATRRHLDELQELRERAATEAIAFRRHLAARGLAALQQEVAALEAAASRIQVFHPVLVPGLLQTPAYAQAVYTAAHPAGRPDLAEAVAARMNRQAVLYQGKRLEFIVGEAALRWHFGPREVTLGQLDRLRQVATIEGVSLGVLPLDIEVPVWHSHGFTLFEAVPGGSIVHVELLTAGPNFRDPDDVARFQDAFERLRKVAVAGEEARALLQRLAAEL